VPRDVLPEKLETPTRDELVRRYERDYQLKVPAAAVGPNTEPGIKARLMADQLLPLYGEAARAAQVVSLDDMDLSQLMERATELGLPARLPAVGGSGSVVLGASVGGGTIFEGDELSDDVTRLRFRVLATAVYQDAQTVAVVGVSTGPATNLPAGRILTWTSPRPGIAQKARVFLQNDGSGLSGGRDVETEDELRTRIRGAQAEPAVAGNDAAYRAEASRTPDVSVQAAFTYPAARGPGTTALAFLLRPSSPGGGRAPSPAQIAAVRAHVVGAFPKDDSLFSATLVPEPVSVALRVRWTRGARGWADAAPWPAYDPGKTTVTAAATPLSMTLSSDAAVPSPPVVGRSVALFDRSAGLWRRKRIASVAGANPWTVTFDAANGASDLSFVPAAGAVVSPWSDSLDALTGAVLAMFDALGPGEMFAGAALFDEGLRRRRSPAPSESWPSELSDRAVAGLYVPGAAIVRVTEPALPHAPTTGSPGVSANFLTLSELSVFPV
jgi:uncharacterized phage protein gp47/JayE